LFVIRPPPTSTLFPYTTLFRSGFGPPRAFCQFGQPPLNVRVKPDRKHGVVPPSYILYTYDRRHVTILSRPAARLEKSLTENQSRSEEHTSELQSRGHLVCRLLL